MAFNSNIKGYMTFGKSFSRGAAFPLEAYEIWTDYDALVAYAANTDPNKDPSYIGQKVAYVDLENNKVTHYGIEIDGTLKELGSAPIGDNKSIVVNTEGVISILGADTADSLTLPRMKEDKSGIEWVPVSQVVEGDGNDNTTYELTTLKNENEETYGIRVKTLFNGTAVEGGEFEIPFDVYTKSQADGKFITAALEAPTPDSNPLAIHICNTAVGRMWNKTGTPETGEQISCSDFFVLQVEELPEKGFSIINNRNAVYFYQLTSEAGTSAYHTYESQGGAWLDVNLDDGDVFVSYTELLNASYEATRF